MVTSVMALLQRTFPPVTLRRHTRSLRRGDHIDPLDLIEWLEDQGYEPEAQVTQKGELALRGGIVDVFPLTSPWPVRLEFFGDELESLRHFDPLTQISREAIESVVLPPGGELGLLKHGMRNAECEREHAESKVANSTAPPRDEPSPATLLDYLPAETIVLLCDPEALADQAAQYLNQVPEGDAFHQTWEECLSAFTSRGMTTLAATEESTLAEEADGAPSRLLGCALPEIPPSAFDVPLFQSLDAWRPLGDRPPEPQIAEAQRREFFAQLHRWLRQGYQVHVFCNNDG
ncbi:MAG: hypothetical protein HYZ36_04730 [Pedosphaera parvula]|nr:hypothetical protein [Pedosphaera parvula]